MAGLTSTPAGLTNNQFKPSSAAEAFTSFGEYIENVNKPLYESKIRPRYMQKLGIAELMNTLGSIFPVNRGEEIYHWEEARLFIDGVGTIAATSPTDTGTKVITDADHKVRVNDDVVIEGNITAHVTAKDATTFTVVPDTAQWDVTFSASESVDYFVYANEKGEATDQQTEWILDNVERIESKTAIISDIYKMSGTKMTDGSWIDIPGKGPAYVFYGEQKGFERFAAMREMKLVLGKFKENTNLSTLSGTQGLFDAVRTRGNIWSGYIETLSDITDITEALDTEAGENRYGAYVNSRQFNFLQDLTADNVGLAAYGMFQNGQQDAINFGFSGLKRSGYEIMFHKWNLLTNPQLLGKNKVVKGVLFPMGEMKDAKTGDMIPNMSIIYKQLGDYSRRFESWITGAAKGIYTDSAGNDSITVNYRSDEGFRLAGANQFVIIE